MSSKRSALNVENRHIIFYWVQKPRLQPHPIVVMSNLFKIQLTQSVKCDAAPDSHSVLLPTQNVKARSKDKVVTATVFFDGGFKAMFITKAAAERLNARRLDISVNL